MFIFVIQVVNTTMELLTLQEHYVFQINHKVSYTFYITADDNYLEKCGTLVALVTAATTLRKEKCDWLDLGPSTFDDFKINEGTCRFKESLGAVIFARDSWTYAV